MQSSCEYGLLADTSRTSNAYAASCCETRDAVAQSGRSASKTYLFDAADLVAEAHQSLGVLGVAALGEADVQPLLARHVGQVELARANFGVLVRVWVRGWVRRVGG